jgi:hypothetical protein
VFTTLGLGQSGEQYYASWVGYGDEGKWMWMARISGQAQDRFITDGFVNEQYSWIDENAFGEYNSTKRVWDWNRVGMNSTIYKLMAWGKHRWCQDNGVVDPEEAEWSKNGLSVGQIEPKYFKEAYFAGVDAGDNYGGIVPLVCLYKIDYPS